MTQLGEQWSLVCQLGLLDFLLFQHPEIEVGKGRMGERKEASVMMFILLHAMRGRGLSVDNLFTYFPL